MLELVLVLSYMFIGLVLYWIGKAVGIFEGSWEEGIGISGFWPIVILFCIVGYIFWIFKWRKEENENISN